MLAQLYILLKRAWQISQEAKEIEDMKSQAREENSIAGGEEENELSKSIGIIKLEIT